MCYFTLNWQLDGKGLLEASFPVPPSINRKDQSFGSERDGHSCAGTIASGTLPAFCMP